MKHMTSLLAFGERKFPDAGLIRGSVERGWQGVAAELRTHPAGEIPAICPQQMELTLAIRGSASAAVERRGSGQFQRTAVRPGTLWLCPIGVEEDSIRITERLEQILHVYIPREQFELVGELGCRPVSPEEIYYLADVDDELVRQICYRMLRELERETAGGRMLIEQLAMSLVTHLVSSYSPHGELREERGKAKGALDRRRLDRVLSYVEDHLESDLSLSELAAVACLSRHHFSRAFKEAMGVPPHAHIGARRLEQAKRLLHCSDLSLAQVAFSCRFSSQASFTRAFQRQVGMSPGEYRRRTAT